MAHDILPVLLVRGSTGQVRMLGPIFLWLISSGGYVGVAAGIGNVPA